MKKIFVIIAFLGLTSVYGEDPLYEEYRYEESTFAWRIYAE